MASACWLARMPVEPAEQDEEALRTGGLTEGDRWRVTAEWRSHLKGRGAMWQLHNSQYV